MTPLLDKINSPSDLRTFTIDQLDHVAAEIRELLISVVSQTGGHLASNLGVVELTLALHYSFSTPDDKLIWDVGHQAYTHKIITGRRDQFSNLRQFSGISGFPRTSESIYDVVSVGHASTSISAALGIATARDLNKEKHAVVAIIGDGSLSGGLAFEGLNNLGSTKTNMTVVLNDNKMSIAKNVGALSRYLTTRVITDKRFNKLRDELWDLTGKLPHVGKSIRNVVQRMDETVKHFVIPGKLFEDLGLRYLGPVDGHNISEMVEIFKYVRQNQIGPTLVHVTTNKGKGYDFAEKDSIKFHGIGCFSPSTGNMSKASTTPTYSDIFGKTLIELSEKDPHIVAITAAMPDGTALNNFHDRFPDRFFDVGIAEEHAVTFAAGMALKGLKPVVVLYSTFLQRAYDQIIHDVALDNLHVVFCIDRAGLVGEDGPTHHGVFDISFLRAIPNMVIMAPKDENELKDMMYMAILTHNGPVAIRYPRGSTPGTPSGEQPVTLPLGQPEVIATGTKVAVISLGDCFKQTATLQTALKQRQIRPTLVNARFVKPLDQDFYRQLFSDHTHIITLENNLLAGGFGSALLELAADMNVLHMIKFLRIGFPDSFIPHGATPKLLADLRLDTNSLVEKISTFCRSA